MSRRLWQYATSTDPEVLAAVEVSAARWPAFREAVTAWAAERGFDNAGISQWGGVLAAIGLPGKPVGFGQWKQPNGRGLAVPFKNNTAELDAMRALKVDAVPIPGVPEMLYAPGPDFTTYMMQPRPFLALGAAWVGVSTAPDVRDGQNRHEYGPQWSECLTSQFYAAKESLA